MNISRREDREVARRTGAATTIYQAPPSQLLGRRPSTSRRRPAYGGFEPIGASGQKSLRGPGARLVHCQGRTGRPESYFPAV